MVERLESKSDNRLATWGETALIGIADIDGGAFRRSNALDALADHLATLAAR